MGHIQVRGNAITWLCLVNPLNANADDTDELTLFLSCSSQSSPRIFKAERALPLSRRVLVMSNC